MFKGLIVLTLFVATFAKSDLLQAFEELLADDSYEALGEEMVGRQGEKGIMFYNGLSEPIYVNVDCDRRNVKKETSEWAVNLRAKYKVISGSVGISNKQSKEYMINYMDTSDKFTKVGSRQYLNQAAGLGCTTLYATVFAIRSNGSPNPFMNAYGVRSGQLLQMTGSLDTPKYRNTYTVCLGDKCGCYGGWCWSECMKGRLQEWCYTGTGYSQSFNYKRCRNDRECQPHWKCAGSCTV